jgi:hypothetical protein
MYTLARTTEPWRKLFPSIKKSGESIEIKLRGQTVKLKIEKKLSMTTSVKQITYGRY